MELFFKFQMKGCDGGEASHRQPHHLRRGTLRPEFDRPAGHIREIPFGFVQNVQGDAAGGRKCHQESRSVHSTRQSVSR